MDIFTEYIKIHLCGSDHQVEVGTAGLRVLFKGTNEALTVGTWEGETEPDRVIVHWTGDISAIAQRLVKFLEAYQRYAQQAGIFLEVYDGKAIKALTVYAGEWDQALDILDQGAALAAYFEAQCEIYDGREG